MADNARSFVAGPDPFGRTWDVEFCWLQNAISIRHADTVDVKFRMRTGEERQEKVIALDHPGLLEIVRRGEGKLSDPWCMRLAGMHLKHMVASYEDMEKTLVTVPAAELAGYARALDAAYGAPPHN